MDVRYLGPLSIRRAGDEIAMGGPKPRMVIAHLVVNARTVVSTDRLIDAVWDGEPPTSARNTLQTYVSHLRRTIGDDRLESHGNGYLLRVTPEEVDASRFERLVGEGRRAEPHDPRTAEALLDEALSLWRGEPFADLPADGSLTGEIIRLRELRWSARESRLAVRLSSGNHAAVIGELESLTAAEPLRERLWDLLMLALYRDGRQADALAAFDRARAILTEEVGVDPSTSLKRMHTRILAQDPSLLLPNSLTTPDGRRSGGVTADDSVRTALTFPTLLAPDTGARYVGRSGLVDGLRRRWKQVSDGGASHVVLLAGEPGIGKTRTATEIARHAHGDGAIVLAGRCDEELAVPYQPWIEALDWQTRHDTTLPVGRFGGELTRLLPDLAHRISDLPAPIATDPRLEEYRLYEAVASWLVAVSSTRPLLLVVDDLHWATNPTLRLLVHVVRAAGEPSAAMMILATYRDTEVDPRHPLTATVADLRRLAANVDVLTVDPLSEDEVAALVSQLTATEGSTGRATTPTSSGACTEGAERLRGTDRLASLTFASSQGNPFFATEVLRHYIEVGAATVEGGTWIVDEPPASVLPDGIRDVVHHRLHRLSSATREVLRLVALLGSDADVSVLSALLESTDQVVDALEDAWHAGLIEETEEDRFRLTHGLIRTALLNELPAVRRRRHHARIVDRLEATRPDDVMALAHHSFQAGPADTERARALRYAIAAGERALAQRAATDAVEWFTRARDLATHLPRIDPALSLYARCGLGEAQRDAGDQTYRTTLLDAARGALAAGHLDLAIRAAITNHRAATVSVVGEVDRERVAVLESLLEHLSATSGTLSEAVGDTPDPGLEPTGSDSGAGVLMGQRARVLALLSLELTFDRTQHDRRLQLADKALELAWDLGDAALEAWVLTTTRVPSTVPDQVPDIAARMHRVVSLTDGGEDPFLRCAAKVTAHQALLGIGDIAGARALAEEAVELASEIGVPYLRILAGFNALQFRAYDGDLAGARADNGAWLAFSQEVGETDTQTWWGAIEALMAIIDGTVSHLTDAIAGFADASPDLVAWRAAHAMALASRGEHDDARSVIDRYELRRADAIPRDWITASAWANLAITAFELDDRELGTMLMSTVAPYRDQWTHVNVFCQGPVEMTYGMAAAAAGQLDEAVEALHHGRALLRERGLRSHLPWASAYLARTLVRRADDNARRVALTVVTEGLEEARSLDMAAMEKHLRAVEERL